MNYKILSICGSGIATSTLVAQRLTEGLKAQGVTQVTINECNVSEASGAIQGNKPDLVISTTALDSVDLRGVKDFSGIPILMNMNTGPLYKEIADYLKSLRP